MKRQEERFLRVRQRVGNSDPTESGYLTLPSLSPVRTQIRSSPERGKTRQKPKDQRWYSYTDPTGRPLTLHTSSRLDDSGRLSHRPSVGRGLDTSRLGEPTGRLLLSLCSSGQLDLEYPSVRLIYE